MSQKSEPNRADLLEQAQLDAAAGTVLRRSIERWTNLVPCMAAVGSPAHILYCIEDARYDILALNEQIKDLRNELARRAPVHRIPYESAEL